METLVRSKPATGRAKTWSEKLRPELKPKIVTPSLKWQKKFGSGKMLIATPLLVDRLIREIPKGNVTTINAIRKKLAADFGADYTCPITTGIFTWIVAHAAEEDKRNYAQRTPYWRVVKDDGRLNPRYPGGEKHHARLLKAEGHTIAKTKGGRHHYLADLSESMIQFD